MLLGQFGKNYFSLSSSTLLHSKSVVLPHTHALEIVISYCRTLNFIGCTSGAPNGCSPRASSGFWKIIHSKVFIRNHFYFPLALLLEVSLAFNLAICFRSWHCLDLKWWFMGCTGGAPNGCSPRASSGFLKIIHSKVFISCPFAENHPLFLPNALEVGIMSLILCFRGQRVFCLWGRVHDLPISC